MNNLLRIRQQLNPPGCNPPKNRSCQEILHHLPRATTKYTLPMARWFKSTAIWRGPTVVMCQDGQEWPLSTWHSQALPALMVWHLGYFPDSHCAVEVLALSHVRVQTSLHMASATYKCVDSFVVTSSWEHKHSKFQTPLMDPTSTAYLSHTEILVIIFGPTPVVFVQTAQMPYQHVHAISATLFKLHPL